MLRGQGSGVSQVLRGKAERPMRVPQTLGRGAGWTWSSRFWGSEMRFLREGRARTQISQFPDLRTLLRSYLLQPSLTQVKRSVAVASSSSPTRTGHQQLHEHQPLCSPENIDAAVEVPSCARVEDRRCAQLFADGRAE